MINREIVIVKKLSLRHIATNWFYEIISWNKEVVSYSKSSGHVPIIDINPRGNKKLKEELNAEKKRADLINFEQPENKYVRIYFYKINLAKKRM